MSALSYPCRAQQTAPPNTAPTVPLSGRKVSVAELAVGDAPAAKVTLGPDRFTVPFGFQGPVLRSELKTSVTVESGYLRIHADCGCTAHGGEFVTVLRRAQL
jgi:hypothetical protein